jgi:CRISPR/Cas system CMR subunit Cmr6 (Cas7 group RAMP superfamily)
MNAEFVPRDTKATLQTVTVEGCSRSLYFDRYSRPDLAKDDRQQFFMEGFKAHRSATRTASWAGTLQRMAADLLYAQLQSRLLLNMAGGVMENAGLCLDRFGLPYIPGSAVKGCARRAATYASLEAEPAGAKADLLFQLCLAFGWGDTDWKAGRKNGREVEPEPHSDFWWAVAPDTGERAKDDAKRNEAWLQVAPTVARRLLDRLRVQKREHPNEPWRDLPDFAGSVSFLPAYPVYMGSPDRSMKVPGLPIEDVPEPGKLELDVVTVHHRHYYTEPAEPKDVAHLHEKWQQWKGLHDTWEREWGSAPDTEEPVPVVFPAVAPGHVFVFALAPLRGARGEDGALVGRARGWLKTGLETFGLGAKTNAGYGWFEATETVQQAVGEALAEHAKKQADEAKRKQDEERRKAEQEARARLRHECEAALAGLTGDERADKEVELLSEAQFDGKVRAFCKEPKKGGPTEEQRRAIVRALRGPRLAYWQAFKTKATKGELAAADQAIRQLSKQMFPGKEDKMP